MKNIDTCNLILKLATKYGFDYYLDLSIDQEAGCPQVQIDILSKGISVFAFFFNTEADNVYFSSVYVMDKAYIDQHFEAWKAEFNAQKPLDYISFFRSDDDNTVHIFGEIDKSLVSAEKITEVFDCFMKPVGLIAKLERECFGV